MFALTTSIALLALLTILNIVGLGVGKWLTIWARLEEPESRQRF